MHVSVRHPVPHYTGDICSETLTLGSTCQVTIHGTRLKFMEKSSAFGLSVMVLEAFIVPGMLWALGVRALVVTDPTFSTRAEFYPNANSCT